MLTNSKGETHPIPQGHDDREYPTLVFDPDTKLYSVDGRIQVYVENAEYPTHWMPAESVLVLLYQQIRSAEGKVEHLKKLAAAVEATLTGGADR